jgi:hypothetical protein
MTNNDNNTRKDATNALIATLVLGWTGPCEASTLVKLTEMPDRVKNASFSKMAGNLKTGLKAVFAVTPGWHFEIAKMPVMRESAGRYL